MPEITFPHTTQTLPPEFNPLRRLYAAAVMQALRDLNNYSVHGFDRDTARRFLHHEADFICNTFKLDHAKFSKFIQERGR